MTRLVLDASVAAKWVLPAADEPLMKEAAELYRRYSRREFGFFVPDVFWPEIGNRLWKAERLGRLSRASAQDALRRMAEENLTTVESIELVEPALSIAIEKRRTVYDSLYVALALRLDAELVTADQRLANAIGTEFPVKWLGALL